MTHEQFESIVQCLEEYSRRAPGRYRMRVRLLAMLGYAYILLVLGVLLALIVAGIVLAVNSNRLHWGVIKIELALLCFALIIGRAMWVQFPRPDGIELTREAAPRLFAMIDALAQALQAPLFHNVLLVPDFNCSVLQRPRFGILGGQESYLLLGLAALAGALTR
jgi:hypothetical protein